MLRVAELAYLDLSESELETYRAQIDEILEYIGKLNELDTTGVEPLVYMNHEENVWREDKVRHEITVEEGLKNAAKHNESFFFVPKIIEK